MKDQNAITDVESKDQKWNRGLDIFIEAVQNLILLYVDVLIIRNVLMS